MANKKSTKRVKKTSRRKPTKKLIAGRWHFNKTVAIVVGVGLAIVGLYFVFTSLAASSAVACATKDCRTSSGYVIDQYGHVVPNVTLTDCDGQTVQTADNGSYSFTLPKNTNYCTHVNTSNYPAHYGGTPVAYNNHPPFNTAAGYEWQVIGAACFNNPANCGAGKIGGNNAVLTHDMAPENNLNFRITNTCPATPPTPPPVGNGGMTYVDWDFHSLISNQVQIPVTFNNFPGTSSDEFFLNPMYFANPTSSIDAMYSGLQTNGMALISYFGTTDLSNTRTGPGSTAIANTGEGTYVSVRNPNFGIGVGRYVLTIKRAEYDGVGDWYNFYVAKPGVRLPGTYIGGIRRPRSKTAPISQVISTFTSATEFFGNTGSRLASYWNLTLEAPVADGNTPFQATTRYSNAPLPPNPNSDIFYNPITKRFDVQLGDSTPRCNPAASYNL